MHDAFGSSEIAGYVTKEAAEATGLAIGTPVTAGTIDAAAEALSVGVKSPGDMMMMYGSTIFIITLTQDRVRDGFVYQLFLRGFDAGSIYRC